MAETALAPKPNVSLKDLLDDFVALRDTLEGMDEDAPDRAYLQALYAHVESKYTEKGDRFAAFLKALEREDKGYGEEIQRFQRRRKAIQRIIDSRREYARDAMASNGITQIKGKAFTISLTGGKRRVEVEDESAIPNEYFTCVPQRIIPEHTELDAVALEADLKRGNNIPGARLVDGEPFITIR